MRTSPNTILLSTAYLPPVEYFAYLLKYKTATIEQYETYPKQSYRNRCHILTEKGPMALSIPVTKVNGNHTKTNEVELFNTERWQLNHWRAIETAYISSPFYLYYKDDLAGFYENPFDKLLDFNTKLTIQLCKLIGTDITINYSDEFQLNYPNTIDLRNAIHPKKKPVLKNPDEYIQVFSDRHPFASNLSIVDVLFNLGPETKSYLENLSEEL